MRLDQELVNRQLVATRSQAESYIKLGKVTVNGKVLTKPGLVIKDSDNLKLNQAEQYVSRAALKLASIAQLLNLNFKEATVLDVGSSTGGFSDYALRQGAKSVVAIDVGSEQLHASLRSNPKIQLHEQTDIRNVILQSTTLQEGAEKVILTTSPDIILIDISFISLRNVLPHIAALANGQTAIVAMCKPQFEADRTLLSKGIIKNETLRRQVLKDFETWARERFVVTTKADSAVSGSKGNQERFYLLKKQL